MYTHMYVVGIDVAGTVLFRFLQHNSGVVVCNGKAGSSYMKTAFLDIGFLF